MTYFSFFYSDFNRVLMLAILCFCYSIGCAQVAEPKIIPPSPNASSFLKYGDTPVSLYTGTTDVSLPLFTVQSGDIKVPIVLKYHGSGIKVSEEASKVGLGWVIEHGGLITRSIIGADDFTGGLDGLGAYHAPAGGDELRVLEGKDYGNSMNVQNSCIPYYLSTPFNHGGYDAQADQYNFNLPGKSGKFILRRDKTPVLAKDEKIDIKLSADLNKWTVRSNDGTTFEFNQKETYIGNELINETGVHTTGWYLTKIISPGGDIVEFKYRVRSTYVRTLGSYSESVGVVAKGNVVQFGTSGNCPLAPYTGKKGAPRDYTNVQLDSIKFNDGFVTFTYGDRTDLENDQKLEKIEIYFRKMTTIPQYDKFKSFELSYLYFNAPLDEDYETNARASSRLMLKKVVERSSSNEAGEIHKFEYFQENSSFSLPAKTSFARDHWGYFNGKTSNNSLIPTFTPFPSSNQVHYYLGHMGDERDPDAAFVNYFALKKIVYPTGGFTEFEYEANEFDLAKSGVNDRSYFADVKDADKVDTHLVYNGFVYGNQPASLADTSKVVDLTNLYIDPYGATSPVEMKAFFRFRSTQPSCSFGSLNVKLELVKMNGTVVSSVNIFEILNASGTPSASCAGNATSVYGINFNNTYLLSPGKYFWRVNIPPTVELIADVGIGISYFKEVNNLAIAGGLRIKSVKHFSNASDLPKTIRYEYRYKDDNGVIQSYGRRMTRPCYQYMQRSYDELCDVMYGATVCQQVTCEALFLTSESLISSSSGIVGYDKVVVYYGDNSEFGKSEYTFLNEPDLLLNYSSVSYFGSGQQVFVPRRPPIFSSLPNVMNGLMTEQIDFRYNGPSSFDTVRIIRNTYENSKPRYLNTTWGVEVRKAINPPPPRDCSLDENLFFPAQQQSWVNLISTHQIDFDQQNPLKTISKLTKYYYGNDSHLLMTKQEDVMADETITQTFKYPTDYNDGQLDEPLKKMKNVLFMHSYPVEKRTLSTRGGLARVISNEVYRYGTTPAGAVLLNEVATALIAVPVGLLLDYLPAYPSLKDYQTRFKLEYNNFNKVIAIKKPNDLTTSYVYGYRNNLVIAEIKNAAPADVFYTSFEDPGQGTSAQGDAKTGKFSASGLTKYLSSLTNGFFTLSYWTKSNGVWSLAKSEVQVTTGSYTIRLNGQVDEVKFYPRDAIINTYSYIPGIGVWQMIDPNDKVTEYEYDVFGRLQLVKDSNKHVVKTFGYNYQKF